VTRVARNSSRRLASRDQLALTYAPQLPTLVKSPPTGPQWVHEIKYDGYRIGALVHRGSVTLITRNGNDWTETFPEIAAAVKEMPLREALIDGEAAVVLDSGNTSFQALQGVLKQHERGRLVYFVFDLLHLDGRDLARLPLDERKAILQRLALEIPAADAVIRYSHHVEGDGTEVLREACKMGLEGIVSKRGDLSYEPGRSRNWLKTKCVRRQEFVIGGFTEPEGSRPGIGALLIGVNVGGNLRFAGKVGTGFTSDVLTDVRRRLNRLEQKECPFSPRPGGWLGRNAHWVRPELVAEVAFTEWTEDGKIRHPSFQGLREDKRASEVTREDQVAMSKENPPRVVATPAHHGKMAAEVAGVRITHPDRPLYNEVAFTKLELARYYDSISDYILPHLKGRPLTLVRCPEGLADECFYMKHSKVWAPRPLRRVNIPEKTKIGEYLVVEALPALIGLVQMDVLEIHTWNSTIDHLEQPDRIVFDLDPGPAISWPQVINSAVLIKSMLQRIGLQSFVKTTGGVGLHLVVPLIPEHDWQDCFAFAKAFAAAIVRTNQELYTISLPKLGRERKILIDYLRNNRTNTSVAAYSTRARPQAPVSVPLRWDELDPELKSDHYTVNNLSERLRQLKNDPWEDYWGCEQRLDPQTMKRVRST
jgi:bifunctional non-homologous end joining protein LigD